jgi:CRISPR/Cas system endoribonuclease Cas6 (RAMP superfamily)
MKSTSNRSIKEEHIEISISSEGFRLRRNYDNYISFRDENFLEILKPHLVERYKKISKENIKEIIDDVMIITNLSRENNLDELLKLED